MKYRAKINDQVFEVEVGDLSACPILATVDGETFEVWIEDGAEPRVTAQAQAPVAAPVTPNVRTTPVPVTNGNGSNGNGSSSASAIQAPIPGVIVEINVKPGDAVTAKQQVCVLEAMKMKNLIRAPRDGKIAAIHIAVGQQVKHHDALVEYAD